MNAPRVLLTRRWPEAIEEMLRAEFDLVTNDSDRPLDAAALAAAMRDCDAFCPTVTDTIDAAVIDQPGRRAQLIGNFGVGFNHIDTEAAQRCGVRVSNTPGVLTDCTADLAMTLLLMVARRAGEGEREVRSRAWAGWRPTHLVGSRVTGKTLGVVGAGRIGIATARRAHHGFGMRIVLYGRSAPDPAVCEELQATVAGSLEELLENSDFVSLHCPSNDETRGLINADRLATMRSDAFLINTARGDVVVESDLANALRNGGIAGAGLDVYAREPEIDPGLMELDNVVLLPHLGSASEETRTAMGMRVVENLRAFFAGRSLPDPVI